VKRIVRRAVTSFAVAAAIMATVGMPTASAASAVRSDEPVPCPRVIGVCTYSEADGQGEPRLYFTDEPLADPTFQTVQNQTPGPWCVYANPYFGAPNQQVESFQTIRNLPFEAASLRRGPC
jgi:hypothetical protein